MSTRKMSSVCVVTTMKCTLFPLWNALSALRERGRKGLVKCMSKKTQSQSKGLVFKFKVSRLLKIQWPIIIISKKTKCHFLQLLQDFFSPSFVWEKECFGFFAMLVKSRWGCGRVLPCWANRQFGLQTRLSLGWTGQRNIEFELRSINFLKTANLVPASEASEPCLLANCMYSQFRLVCIRIVRNFG